MKIWDISIRNPVFMTMILVAGLVLGTIAYFTMPVDLFPDVEFPVVVVNTVYPGASPEEVENQITSLMEEELSSIAGLDEISSFSSESVSTVVMLFDLDTPAIQASQDVREEVGLLRNRLPSDVEDPIVRRFDPTAAPIMLLAIADNTGQTAPVDLREQVEEFVQAPLLRVEGVSAVDVNGGEVREIRVELDKAAMDARNVTADEVSGALQRANVNIPGGSVIDSGTELLVRTPGEFATVEEINDVVVRQGVSPIYVRDIASVVDDFEERSVVTLLNGEESIVLTLRKASGTNTLEVSEGVKKELERIKEANPEWDVVIGGDLANEVRGAADGAIEDLLWGALLASLVIWLFFRDFRSTLITVAGIPVIMISTLFLMQLFGIGLNQISLLALALVVGLVIDDGIVVRENIMRWIERGYSRRAAASKGTAEVILPVIATSATILAVFLPVAYASGIIGRFFRDFGLTVSLAIVVSTFESLTMAPMLSAYFAKERKGSIEIDEARAEEESGRTWLDRMYKRSLNFAMDHKWIVLVGTVAVVIFSVMSLRYINQSFIPTIDQGTFDVSMELPPGTPLSTTQREAEKVETIMRSHPAVENIFSTVGGVSSPNTAAFAVQLAGGVESEWESREVIAELREPLASVPGIAFKIADNLTGGDDILGNRDILIIATALSGTYAELGEEAHNVAKQLAEIPGLTDIEVTYKPGQPELQLDVDPVRAANFGLSTAQVGATVRSLVNGETASTFRGEGSEADIVVIMSEADRANVDNILDINLPSPTGQFIPVRNVAEATLATGPTMISRIDRQPSVSIGANIVGRDMAEVNTDVRAFLETVAVPPNVELKMGGDAEMQADGFQSLGLAMLLSIVFVYMVLASQFGSFIQPVIIMLAMPLAIIGALLALIVTGKPLDLTAFIGFIMLMGLVTKNSILLVDFANKARANGSTADEAMRIAGPIRLRPILMTAFSMILAMTPVVLGLGAAGEFRSPMGTAIMGGMFTSTLLTLMVVPVAYSIVVGLLDRLSARRAARKQAKAEAELTEQESGRGIELESSDEQGTPPTTGEVQPAGD